jgi:hypothetical protein
MASGVVSATVDRRPSIASKAPGILRSSAGRCRLSAHCRARQPTPTNNCALISYQNNVLGKLDNLPQCAR